MTICEKKQGSTRCWYWYQPLVPKLVPTFLIFKFFQFFSKEYFFSKEKIFFSKVVHFMKKMISILTQKNP